MYAVTLANFFACGSKVLDLSPVVRCPLGERTTNHEKKIK